MRIAILTNDYPPNAQGGAGVIAEIYATALRDRGHEVTVEVCRPAFRQMSGLRRLVFHLQDLFARNELVKKIVATKPDVLLTHNLAGCGIGTPLAVQRQGIRWVHVLHDVQLIEPSGRIVVGESFSFFRWIWRAAWSTLRRIAIGRPDVVVSPTEWLLEFHRHRGFFVTVNGRVIPNPIPNIDRAAGDGPRDGIIFVGRLDPEKGVRVLVDAWRALGDQRPVLRLVSSGSLEHFYRAQKDPRLIVHGQLPNNETRALMQKASILVVPSLLIENQPTVILEGLAAGCRVIASDVGGIPETLGVAGKIVPAGDVGALRAALSETFPTVATVAVLSAHRVDVAAAALEGVLKSNL